MRLLGITITKQFELIIIDFDNGLDWQDLCHGRLTVMGRFHGVAVPRVGADVQLPDAHGVQEVHGAVV